MGNFKLHNFNTILVSGIDPINPDGSFNEATSDFFYTGDVTYVLNPVTTLLNELSGFEYNFWKEYDNSWIDIDLPEVVLQHAHNHFRSLAIKTLFKEGITFTNLEKVVNIACGYPFILTSGICESIDTDSNYHTIVQSVDGSGQTIQYKIDSSLDLKISEGDTVGYFDPIISGIDIYDLKTDRATWFPLFNLTNIQNEDFRLNRDRVVGIIVNRYFQYSNTFLERLLLRYVPKEVILFLKLN